MTRVLTIALVLAVVFTLGTMMTGCYVPPLSGDGTPRENVSGLHVSIDYVTGCEYLVGQNDVSITPRMDAGGRQVCREHRQPESEE